MWLECCSQTEIADAVGVDQATINRWLADAKAQICADASPPPSRQHFDIWQFAKAGQDAGQQSYFGALPPLRPLRFQHKCRRCFLGVRAIPKALPKVTELFLSVLAVR